MTQMGRSLLMVLTLGLALAIPQAYAGMISTDQTERERVKAMLERPEVVVEIQKMGIAPQEAVARVDAMTDAEVIQLAGRLDMVPAGGQMSDHNLLLVILLVVVVALLI